MRRTTRRDRASSRSRSPGSQEQTDAPPAVSAATDAAAEPAKETAAVEHLARYRRIFEASNEAIAIIGPQGEYLEQNAAHRALVGYTDDELRGKTPAIHLGDVVFGTIAKELQDKGAYRGEHVSLTREGPVDIEVSAFTLRDEQGQPVCHVGIKRDMRPHKRAEAQLRRQVAQLESIASLTDALVRAETAQDLDQAALRSIASALRTDRAAILLYDAKEVMRFRASMGLSDAYKAAVEGHSPWKRGEKDPRPILVPDVVKNEALAPLLPTILGERIRALAFVPLSYRGKLLGKFMAYFDTPHEFTAEEMRVAQIIADHVAFAIERTRSEAQLRESQARLQGILENTTAVMYVKDTEGRYELVNRRYEELFHVAQEDVRGRTDYDLFPSEAAQAFRKNDLDVIASGDAIEFEEVVPHDDGVHTYISVKFPLRDASGAIRSVCGISTDITDRMRAQQAILDSQQRLDAVVRQMPAGVLLAEAPSGKLLLGNEQVERIWRHPFVACASVDQYRAYQGFAKDGRALEGWDWPLARSIQRGEVVRGEEIPILRGDGTRGVIQVSSTPIRDPQGTIVAAVMVFDDITERKRGEEELRRANERLREMDELRTQLLNTVSHELSTPLTPISLQLQMLRTRGDLNDRQRKTLSIVDRNLERLAGLVKEIVDVARLQTGKLPVQREDLDLAEIVRDAGESFGEAAKHAGVGLDVRAVQPLPISGDPQRLEQVLFNLLSNAIKFTPPGGSVTVEAISERGEAIVVTRDTGVGFSAEQRDRLFQPFSQLHQNPALIRGGTGLGLYISKGIIEEHGGSIQCESAGPGQGSAFRFSLPLRAEAPPPPSPDAARLPPA